MTTFFCPSCWTVLRPDEDPCPSCGCGVEERLRTQSYTRGLIRALSHPEPQTPLRAAHILGMRRDGSAVLPLRRKAGETEDLYLALACLEALARIGGLEALEAVREFCDDERFLLAQRARELAAEVAEAGRSLGTRPGGPS